jgi:hypothetical protein
MPKIGPGWPADNSSHRPAGGRRYEEPRRRRRGSSVSRQPFYEIGDVLLGGIVGPLVLRQMAGIVGLDFAFENALTTLPEQSTPPTADRRWSARKSLQTKAFPAECGIRGAFRWAKRPSRSERRLCGSRVAGRNS